MVYSDAYNVREAGEAAGQLANPYFNRTAEHFCSHLHAPVDPRPVSDSITRGADGVYIAWNVFTEYFTMGSIVHKQIVHYLIDRLIDKTAFVSLPAQGKATLAYQEENNRYILNMLYGAPVKRGAVEVIEDLPAVYDISVRLRLEAPRTVYLALSGEAIPFEFKEGFVEFTVPRLECHSIAVIQY